MSVFGDGTDPYDSTTNYWTWEVALLYGALMSATDPVAVVRNRVNARWRARARCTPHRPVDTAPCPTLLS